MRECFRFAGCDLPTLIVKLPVLTKIFCRPWIRLSVRLHAYQRCFAVARSDNLSPCGKVRKGFVNLDRTIAFSDLSGPEKQLRLVVRASIHYALPLAYELREKYVDAGVRVGALDVYRELPLLDLSLR